MRRRAPATAVALCFLTASLGVQGQPAPSRDLRVKPVANRKVALVVGNSAYPKSPLRNPVNDARAVTAALTGLGFQTQSALDLNLRLLERSINDFVARVQPGDVAMFYYAGHGIQLEGENYIVPVDFDAKDEADAKYVSYSVSRMQERLEKAGARVVLIVLDACRNNPFQQTRSATGGGGLAAMGSGKGTLIAFATAPGKTADDNPRGSNGLFTTHLVNAMRQPGLSVDQMFNRVREGVYNESNGRQVPWTVSSVIGDLYLGAGEGASVVSGGNLPVPPPPVVQQPQASSAIVRNAVTPPPPVSEPLVVDHSTTLAAANAALERGDFGEAIRQSQTVLRADPRNKDALVILAGGFYRTGRWDTFVPAARQAVQAGATLNILLGHHHTLTGIHPSTLSISADKIAYRSMGGSCGQNPIEVPIKSLVSAQSVTSQQREIFLNVKLMDDKGKQRNFNFADPESAIHKDPQTSLPIVTATARAPKLVQSLAALLNQIAMPR